MDENLKKVEQALHKAQEDLWEAEEALHQAEEGDAPQQAPMREAPSGTPSAEQEGPPVSSSEAPNEEVASPEVSAPEVLSGAAQERPASSSSGKWRVEFDRENCIGAGACVAANAQFWSIDEDGKATLKSATYDETKRRWVLELDDGPELQKQRDAAGVCPVTVIHIIDPDGNQEI